LSSIIPFEPEHIPEALSLWRATEHIGLSGADEPEALVRFLDRNPGLSFVAVDTGRLAGTVLCGHDGRRGYIYHLVVSESRRRSGLGRRLLERCLDSLHIAGIGKCHAFVFHRNPFAERFWRPTGWELRDDLLVYSRQVEGGIQEPSPGGGP
jgi:ribosomal protein S18 acetylase RimI-like enzyme